MSPSFTPDADLDLLFSADLISPQVKAELHPDIHLRPLASTDYHRNHLSVLSVLTNVTDPGSGAWVEQFNAMRAAGSVSADFQTYFTIVIIDKPSDTIIGVGSVFIERKFLHGLRSVGHIEDIAVDKGQQGKKLGMRIIQALTYISESKGCYKTILNCSDANIPFYQKCGFEKKENEMAKYTPERAQSPQRL